MEEENKTKKADYSINWMVFWVLLIATVVWVVTWMLPGSGRGRSEPGRPQESPLEVLQRRLANGEIDTDEYLRVRDALSQKTFGNPASVRAPQGGE